MTPHWREMSQEGQKPESEILPFEKGDWAQEELKQ